MGVGLSAVWEARRENGVEAQSSDNAVGTYAYTYNRTF